MAQFQLSVGGCKVHETSRFKIISYLHVMHFTSSQSVSLGYFMLNSILYILLDGVLVLKIQHQNGKPQWVKLACEITIKTAFNSGLNKMVDIFSNVSSRIRMFNFPFKFISRGPTSTLSQHWLRWSEIRANHSLLYWGIQVSLSLDKLMVNSMHITMTS